MPTGYTCIIEDKPETTFEEFALRCARAFGACIHQRDDGMSVEPAAPELDPYYRKRLLDAEAEARDLETISSEEAVRRCAQEREYVVSSHAACLESQTRKNGLYNAMLAKVMAWEPPTPDHVNLKKFMVEQWLDSKRKYATESVRYAREALEKHERAIAEAAKWVAELRASLGSPSHSKGGSEP